MHENLSAQYFRFRLYFKWNASGKKMCKSLFIGTRNIRRYFAAVIKQNTSNIDTRSYYIISRSLLEVIKRNSPENISAAYANEYRKNVYLYEKCLLTRFQIFGPSNRNVVSSKMPRKREKTLHQPEKFYLGIHGSAKDSKKRVKVRPIVT